LAEYAWPALVIAATRLGQEDLVSAALDDFSPRAIEDLVPQPLPPGGLWDPTLPAAPNPPPAPLHWRVFFSTAADRRAAAADLRQRFSDMQLECVDIADDDWAARSQRALHAITAGRFIVAPPWDVPTGIETDVVVILIEPSRGFGTGHHASTRLCLRALSDVNVSGGRVLDLGTGSGVLAFACALKGAREVVAVDVDADAIDAARASARLNVLPVPIDFRIVDFRDAASEGSIDGSYDVVTANLTGGMLISAAPRIASLAASGGIVVMSGFDEDERQAVRHAFAETMEQIASFSEEGWVGLVLRAPKTQR